MNLRIKFSFVLKLFVFYAVFIISALSFHADFNVISSVDIKQAENNGYNIILNSDKIVKISEITKDINSLAFIVNSAVPSDAIEISYDSNSDLNNVIVQKKNAYNTAITIQGKNIENSQIYVNSLYDGTLTKADLQNNSFNKYTLFSLLFIFALIALFKPKKKNNNLQTPKKLNKKTVNTYNSTLRNKNNMRQDVLPSMNYKVTGSFKNSVVTIPQELSVNSYNELPQKIRKAG